jgi:hypothetical protein
MKMIEPLDLANQLLVLEFSTTPTGPPDLEPLSPNRQVFKISARGPVAGALVGEMSASVTEVHTVPPPAHQGIAITFTLETEQGTIEGYYSGSIHLEEGGRKLLINGYGHILSVTGAYAELFLAEVFVSSEVPRVDGRGLGEKGRMTISPRYT